MKNTIILKSTTNEDLETLFTFQLNEEANYLAAFTSKNPNDKVAYLDKWKKLVTNPDINSKTIFLKNGIVGSIAKFKMDGKWQITYWIDRDYWGKGIATNALKLFLSLEKPRPIYGSVAFDNLGSIKVLENWN